MPEAPAKRYVFLDHLRGWTFALMAFDHALHAYAQEFGQFWFFRDYERLSFFDGFYLFNQSMIMPLLFFISGMFVVPHLMRLGFPEYLRRRLIKLGIPWLLGIPLIVPLLSYPKYHQYVNSVPSYWTYWTEIFFAERLQAGPFWVMFALLAYALVFLAMRLLWPNLIPQLGRFVTFIAEKPLVGISTFCALAAVIYGMSDLLWGAPWWIGFGKLFYLQGARFIMNFVYFMMGAGFMASGLLDQPAFWERYHRVLPKLLIGLAISAVCYIGYSLAYLDEGAYSDTIHRAIRLSGFQWDQILALLPSEAPRILIRTTLLGILGCFQVICLIGLFHRYLAKPKPMWQSLARNAYGIFIWHESMMVWLQFGLLEVSFAPYIKMVTVFLVGFWGAWLLNDYLRRIPLFAPVLDGAYQFKRPRRKHP